MTQPSTQTSATATVQFDAALRAAAACARTKYAGEAARIDRGLVIALNGGVTLHADGTTTVQSASDKEVSYVMRAGLCECPDVSTAPAGRCKHWFSWMLWRKAGTLLGDTHMPLHHAYHMASGEEGHARLLVAQRATFYPGGRQYSFICHRDELCVGPVVQPQGRPY